MIAEHTCLLPVPQLDLNYRIVGPEREKILQLIEHQQVSRTRDVNQVHAKRPRIRLLIICNQRPENRI